MRSSSASVRNVVSSIPIPTNIPFGDQIAHLEVVEPVEARYAQPRARFHTELSERLGKLGLDRLYTHQAEAYDAAMEGRDILAVTGTNSGKTLCYNLPALQWSLTEPAARMLYLFPTKALAQDQLGKLEELIPGPQIRAATYDGDTPTSQRSAIRRLAHIVLTNPDMLHVGILPGHENWTKFLKSLRLIVIDELHVYRGVFGSHVANVLRRLLRLCEWHRARPQIIACSATIGNPEELFHKLTGHDATLIADDGAPRGRRTFVFWNPATEKERMSLSPNRVTSEMVSTLAESGSRSIAFSRSRVSAELVLRYTRQRLERGGRVSPEKVDSYRAGYTPKERRGIEQALFKGDLLAVSATDAMELGVDVGGLDAVVMNGYPGTVSSFFQQAGRAGRGARDGLAVMVTHADALEQFFARNPQMLLKGVNESVSLNPENPQILSQQLLCAAYERPLTPSDLARFGESALDRAEDLDRSGELGFNAGMFFYPSHEAPAPKVNIRGGGRDEVTLIAEDKVLGTMERWRAMQYAHDGAVYLHRGQHFVVDRLDLDRLQATLTRRETEYFTMPSVETVLEQTVEASAKPWPGITLSLVGAEVTSTLVGFRRVLMHGGQTLDLEPLDYPPTTFETLAVRIDLPAPSRPEEVLSVHGLEHALVAVAPFIAGCDRRDLGSVWRAFSSDTLRPAIFVYDQTPGGVGLCEEWYANFGAWVVAAHRLVSSCDCAEGCPACLLSAGCMAGAEALDKAGAIARLAALSP